MSMRKIGFMIGIFLCLLLSIVHAYAATAFIVIYSTDNQTEHGAIKFQDTPYGLLIIPKLHKLPPGIHGFHVHEHASCNTYGMEAGGHYDPKQYMVHLGPYQDLGHLGDMPALFVDTQGSANLPILAPRLHVSDLHGHAIMIHEGGDNYSDTPEKLGGGGKRIACGVIK